MPTLAEVEVFELIYAIPPEGAVNDNTHSFVILESRSCTKSETPPILVSLSVPPPDNKDNVWSSVFVPLPPLNNVLFLLANQNGLPVVVSIAIMKIESVPISRVQRIWVGLMFDPVMGMP